MNGFILRNGRSSRTDAIMLSCQQTDDINTYYGNIRRPGWAVIGLDIPLSYCRLIIHTTDCNGPRQSTLPLAT